MNRFLNMLIALLVPSLVGCGSNPKVQDVPEEIYACPMPGTLEADEEPTENDSIVIEPDTIKNNKQINKQKHGRKTEPVG